MGLQRGHHARPLEWIAEKLIFLVSLSAIVMVFLIFLFVAREALPVILGKTSNSSTQKIVPVDQMDKLSQVEMQEYLGITPLQSPRWIARPNRR